MWFWCSNKQHNSLQRSTGHLQHDESHVWPFLTCIWKYLKPRQRPSISPSEECWIFLQHRHPTKEAVYDFIPPRWMPTLPPCGSEGSPSENLTPANECWWAVSNWRSLNKSHRGRLLILMTHPDHAARHTSLPTHTHPLLPFSPMWERSSALSSILSSKMNSSQTATIWTKQAFMKLPIHISPPEQLMWKKIHMY